VIDWLIDWFRYGARLPGERARNQHQWEAAAVVCSHHVSHVATTHSATATSPTLTAATTQTHAPRRGRSQQIRQRRRRRCCWEWKYSSVQIIRIITVIRDHNCAVISGCFYPCFYTYLFIHSFFILTHKTYI